MQAVQGEGLLLTLSASYISDLISPSNRATALSLNLAGIAFAYTVGPVVSGRLPSRLTVWLSAGGSVVAVFLMLFGIPESVTNSAKQQVYIPCLQPFPTQVTHSQASYPTLFTATCNSTKVR